MSDESYTSATVWAAEGARVALVICRTCGAALLLDPRENTDWPEHHRQWHASEASA